MTKLYDGLSSTVARALATANPAVQVRLDQATPPAAGDTIIADGAGGMNWGPGGGLPEILQAIALADPPTTAGQAPLYDGVGITWGAPSGGGGGGPALTGNPYIDPWGTPSDVDDEFDSGPPDLGERGWTLYNATDGLTMTRLGDVQIDSTTLLSSDRYWSTISGSFLMLQIPDGKDVWLLRSPGSPLVGTSAHTMFVRWSHWMPQAMASIDGAGNGSSWLGDYERNWLMLARVQSASGSPTGAGYSQMGLAWDDIAPCIRFEDSGTAWQYKTTAANFAHASLSAMRFCNNSTARRFSAVSAESGHVRVNYQPSFMAYSAFNAARVGLRMRSFQSGSGVYCFDYFRLRAGNAWWSQPG